MGAAKGADAFVLLGFVLGLGILCVLRSNSFTTSSEVTSGKFRTDYFVQVRANSPGVTGKPRYPKVSTVAALYTFSDTTRVQIILGENCLVQADASREKNYLFFVIEGLISTHTFEGGPVSLYFFLLKTMCS